MDDLGAFRRIHVVGVAGAGMSGIATLLAGLGHTVTGSDVRGGPALDGLAAAGLDVRVGHHPGQAAAADLVAASSAVPDDDPELAGARSAGVPVWRRPRLLGALTAKRPALGVTGTHGKTTTTAMTITALRATGADPSYLVGGDLGGPGTNAHLGGGDVFVVEADEAFGTFLSLRLSSLVVTNVEADHLDHYGTFAAVEDAFRSVARRVEGPVVACLDDPGSRRLAAACGAAGYGMSADAAWRITRVRHASWWVGFDLVGGGRVTPVMVPKPGEHVARNAAGVLALVGELGLDLEAAAGGLGGFSGVRRRWDLRGDPGGVAVVDDYAHHPTEVSAILTAARMGGWARIWAVFQPHLYSRTAEFAGAFGAALAAADRVVITDVYGAREAPLPGVTGRLVADAAGEAGAPVEYLPSRPDLAPFLAERVAEGDLVLVLGAGDITETAGELVDLLERRS